MENEVISLRLQEKEKALAELFAEYMVLVSADAEMRLSASRPLFDGKAEAEHTEALLKSVDAFLRPYTEEFLGTVNSLSRAFRSEIADSVEE